jgi:hypothetical protein
MSVDDFMTYARYIDRKLAAEEAAIEEAKAASRV